MALHPFQQTEYNKDDTRYTETVSGGKMMKPGMHDVRIVDIKDDKENPIIDVVFENAVGQTLKQRIPLTEYQSNELSIKFVNFVRAIVGTQKKTDKVITALYKDPSLFQVFMDCTLQIKVVESTYGYRVEKHADVFKIVDAGDGKFTDVISEHFADREFDDFKQLREAVSVFNETNKADPKIPYLKGAFPKIYLFLRSEKGVEENVSAIQSVISATSSSTGNRSNSKSTNHLQQLAGKIK